MPRPMAINVLNSAIAVTRTAPQVWYTTAFISSVGRANWDAKLLAFAKELAASQDDSIVSNDISLLGALAVKLPDACTALDGLRSHPSPWVASSAAGELVTGHHCPRYNSGVLATLTKQASNAKTTSITTSMVLDELCSDPALSAADRAKAAPLAKKLAASKTATPSTRSFALRAALSCDAKGGKAFVGKFKHDKDEIVAKTAMKLASSD